MLIYLVTEVRNWLGSAWRFTLESGPLCVDRVELHTESHRVRNKKEGSGLDVERCLVCRLIRRWNCDETHTCRSSVYQSV